MITSEHFSFIYCSRRLSKSPRTPPSSPSKCAWQESMHFTDYMSTKILQLSFKCIIQANSKVDQLKAIFLFEHEKVEDGLPRSEEMEVALSISQHPLTVSWCESESFGPGEGHLYVKSVWFRLSVRGKINWTRGWESEEYKEMEKEKKGREEKREAWWRNSIQRYQGSAAICQPLGRPFKRLDWFLVSMCVTGLWPFPPVQSACCLPFEGHLCREQYALRGTIRSHG